MHCKGDVGDGIRAEPGEATMARLSPRAAPRHLVSTRCAPPSSPPRLLSKLFRNCLKTEIESLKRISRVFERNGNGAFSGVLV